MPQPSNCENQLEANRVTLLERFNQLPQSDALVIKGKEKSLFLQMRSQRGSRFRGVSKNGHKWQVSRLNLFLLIFLSLNLGHDCKRRAAQILGRHYL